MTLTKERKLEIGFALTVARLRREGINISSNTRQEFKALSAETGIPANEIQQFFLDLLPAVIGNAFGFAEVSMTVSTKAAPSTSKDLHNATDPKKQH